MRKLVFATVGVALSAFVGISLASAPQAADTPTLPFELRSLDGSANNTMHRDWGRAGTQYPRVARANYTDGIARPVTGPPARYLSNRIFDDVGQNLFSENDISQWGWAWGQFIDHDIGLRDEQPAENADMPYDRHDRLEDFSNDVGSIAFSRTPAAPGTGSRSPRQQINTISSFIDGSQVYGVTGARLDWLRDGNADGDPSNNAATLLMSADNYLP